MNWGLGTLYQRMEARSPERPEQASVIAHQRAYTAGGANRSAVGGSGSVTPHAARSQTTTESVASLTRHDHVDRRRIAAATRTSVRKVNLPPIVDRADATVNPRDAAALPCSSCGVDCQPFVR